MSTTIRNVSLLRVCLAIRLRITPGECSLCGLHRGAYFLGCPLKVLGTSLDHEFADLRPGPKALLLQAEFRVVGKEKAFGDSSISLNDKDEVNSLV